MFGSCKIFSGNAIFGKGKCIQAVWLPQICFTENQFRCLVRSNILQKMLFVLRKIKLCNQNRKNKRRENLINHSTASNEKVRVIQFNPIPHSHFPTNQTDPQKKQNLEKKIHQIWSNWEKKEEREVIGFDLEARSRGGGEGEIERRRRDWAALESIFAWSARCCDRQDRCDRHGATIDETGAVLRLTRPMECGSSNWSSVWGVRCCERAQTVLCEEWKWFEVKIWTEMILWVFWFILRSKGKIISVDWIYWFNQTLKF